MTKQKTTSGQLKLTIEEKRTRSTTSTGQRYFRRQDTLGYLLRTVERAFTRAFQARLEQEGMTMGMWYYLRALWETDGITQRELSTNVDTMDSSTGSALAKMERRGLVYRVPDPHDRRKSYIYLTDKAKADRERLMRHVVDLQEFATTGLSREDERQLRRLLEAIRENLKHDPLSGGNRR